MAETSRVVGGLAPFRLFRAYVDPDDREARDFIESTVRDEFERGERAHV